MKFIFVHRAVVSLFRGILAEGRIGKWGFRLMGGGGGEERGVRSRNLGWVVLTTSLSEYLIRSAFLSGMPGLGMAISAGKLPSLLAEESSQEMNWQPLDVQPEVISSTTAILASFFSPTDLVDSSIVVLLESVSLRVMGRRKKGTGNSISLSIEYSIS